AIILNDLSLNMDMVGAPFDGQPYGNVIVNNRPTGPWVMLDPAAGQNYVQCGEQPDLEANNGQSEFYRTRSLPWSQSSRGSGRFASTSVAPGTAESHPDSSQTVHSGTTTMGRVCSNIACANLCNY